MVSFIRVGYATFVRNWLIITRAYPWSIFLGTFLQGLGTILLSYFIYHNLALGHISNDFISYTSTSNYISYIIVGISTFLFTSSILLGVSRSMITEKRQGTLTGLVMAPISRTAYLIGVTSQWLLTSLLETCTLLLIAWPLGLHFDHVNVLIFLLAIPVLLLSLFGMAVTLGASMLATGDTHILQNTLFTVIILLSGFIFPPEYLPLPLQWISSLIPITGALHLLRAALLQNASLATEGGTILASTLLGLLYSAIGILLMRKAEYQAIEEKQA
jgi:ABC-2 type transport system permease protein